MGDVCFPSVISSDFFLKIKRLHNSDNTRHTLLVYVTQQNATDTVSLYMNPVLCTRKCFLLFLKRNISKGMRNLQQVLPIMYV